MSATETAAFVLTVQESQAVAALDRTRKSAESLGGGMEKAAAGTKTFEDRAKGVQQKMGPIAASVGGLSGSLSLMGGSAGKAAAGMGALAGAIGSGSPLVIGLSLVATSIAGVVTLLQNAKKAQEEYLKLLSGPGIRFSGDAAGAARALRQAEMTSDLDPVMAATVVGADNIEQANVAAKAELDLLNQKKQRLENVEKTLKIADGNANDRLVAQKGALEVEREKLKLEIQGGEISARNAAETAKNVRDEAADIVRLARLREDERQKTEAAAKAKAKADQAAAKALSERLAAEKKAADEQAKYTEQIGYGITFAEDPYIEAERLRLDAEDSFRAAREEARGLERKRELDESIAYEKERQEQVKNRIEAELRLEKDRAAEVKRIREQEEQQRAQILTAGLSTLVNVGSQLAYDLATQQEKAFERAAAAAISSVGQQIVGYGIEAVVRGALMNAALPGSGLPSMAAGGVAIGIGGAMAVSGSVAAASLGGLGGASAGGSGSPSSGAARSRGISAGGGGGGGAGGNVTVNVSYGVSGPAAEDTARAVVGALHVGAARGMIGREVMR